MDKEMRDVMRVHEHGHAEYVKECIRCANRATAMAAQFAKMEDRLDAEVSEWQ